jgi:pimeloyl-ACP methyl ester carboxylesterase
VTPLVLVHGNPETAVIWDPLVAALDREAIRLSPPGFGAPVPDGFERTPAGYRDWLIGELEAIGEPVDLVGHDMGGRHTVNVAVTRPDLLRTWVSDAIGSFHPGYVWHELAQIWQKQPDGEHWIAAQLALTPEQRAQRFLDRGMAPSMAVRISAGFDSTMAACILELYRAPQPSIDLGAAAARPGLVVLATGDTAVGTERQRRETAAAAGARVAVVDGGHWWLTEPAAIDAGAAALRAFWAAA